MLRLALIIRTIWLLCFSFSVFYSSWWRWVHTLLRKAWEIICMARWPLSSSATWRFASSLPSYPGLRSVPDPQRVSPRFTTLLLLLMLPLPCRCYCLFFLMFICPRLPSEEVQDVFFPATSSSISSSPSSPASTPSLSTSICLSACSPLVIKRWDD